MIKGVRMHQKLIFLISLLSSIFLLLSCSSNNPVQVDEEEQLIDEQLNEEVAKVMNIYSQAIVKNDPLLVKELRTVLSEFDMKYQSNICDEFDANLQEYMQMKQKRSNNNTPLADLPVSYDGAVYLSGGIKGMQSLILTFISPTATRGKYFHGAELDLDKFDPTNLEAPCFQSATAKGAGYETPMEWMTKVNVSVFKPKKALNSSSINTSQKNMHYYCKPDNTNMKYGFFKNLTNIFSPVTKEDNYYWYCSKIIWRVYNELGINLDSNTPLIKWKSSGLYSIVYAYYRSKYWYSKKKAMRKLNEYIENTKNTLVLAEEIYFSPYLRKVYEVVREY
jgi:hypothetical protein